MYLKKIEVYGFKSFADKIEMEFKDGITAIVGPNGSGKSNVSDAIKWVLGEQKVKSLRGNKMEDVIFSGTETRKPLGYAQVTLILDNSEGIFPIEFNELSITRRLFRSGDSEYYINKSLCRLRDIQDLFSDTGLGKEGYSIIGQGKIDNIVSSNSHDRRLLFEEAAGIVKYKNRKNESERKLNKTQDNLYRVTDIISELEKQLNPLKKQSEKAKNYLNLRDKLKNIELNLFVHKVDEIKKELTELNTNKLDSMANLKEKEEEFLIIDERFQSIREEIQILDNKIKTINEELLAISENSEKNNTQIQVLITKIDSNKNSINNIEIEIKDIEEKNISLENKLKIFQDDIANTSKLLNENKVLLKTKADRKKEYEVSEMENTKFYTEKKETLNNIKDSILIINNKISILDSKITNFTDNIKNVNERIEELTKEVKNSQQKLNDSKETKNILTKKIDIEKNSINENKKKFMDNEEKQKKVLKELSLYENNYNILHSKYNLLKNNEDLKGYYYSVRELLKEKKNDSFLNSKLHNIVGNLLNVTKEYSNAIETALGNTVQNLITEDEDAAHECIKILNKNNWGRATFLPLNIIKGEVLKLSENIKNEKGFINIASKIITYDNKYEGIFQNLLGRVLIVDNMESGKRISKKSGYRYKIVTLKGEVFFPGGAIVGGNQRNNKSNIIQKKQELQDINMQIKNLKVKIETLKSKKSKLDVIITEMKNLINNSEYKLNEYFIEKKLIEQNINQIENDINSSKKTINKLQEEYELMLENKSNNYLEKQTLSEKIKLLQEDKIKIEKLEKTTESKENYKEKIYDLNEEIMSLNLEIAKLEEKHIHLNNQLNDININISNNKDKLMNESKKINDLKNESNQMEMSIEEIKTVLKDSNKEKTILLNKSEEYNKNKNKNNLLFDKMQNDIKDVNYDNKLINEALNKLEIKIDRKQSEIDHMQSNIFENYQMNYLMASEFRYEIQNISDEVKSLNSYKNKIKALGNINVGAIDQYREVKERFEFLTQQRDDLLLAKDELKNIINEITNNMENQFLEQFKLIQSKFSIIFKQLFNGGNAKLTIEDSTNLMETGIEIEAQPPGKKLKNITLLSGGEKALTAIALVFSIINIKPTPFCVLDEIDAALDDSNVDRFSTYLNKFSKENQFITITHRKGTMEIADRLYGISMAKDGVSKIISVQLTEMLDDKVGNKDGK
ncbi:MAG: chromosome segregation protein SMC [Eubacteriaceae bacterium]